MDGAPKISFSSDDTVEERIKKHRILSERVDNKLDALSEEDLWKLLRINKMGWKIQQWEECYARYREEELMKIGLKSKEEYQNYFFEFMNLIKSNQNLFSGYYQNEEQMIDDFKCNLKTMIKVHENQSKGDNCLDVNGNLKKQRESWKGSEVYLESDFQNMYNRLKKYKDQNDETKDLIRLLEELINNYLEESIKSCKDYDPNKDYSHYFK